MHLQNIAEATPVTAYLSCYELQLSLDFKKRLEQHGSIKRVRKKTTHMSISHMCIAFTKCFLTNLHFCARKNQSQNSRHDYKHIYIQSK